MLTGRGQASRRRKASTRYLRLVTLPARSMIRMWRHPRRPTSSPFLYALPPPHPAGGVERVGAVAGGLLSSSLHACTGPVTQPSRARPPIAAGKRPRCGQITFYCLSPFKPIAYSCTPARRTVDAPSGLRLPFSPPTTLQACRPDRLFPSHHPIVLHATGGSAALGLRVSQLAYLDCIDAVTLDRLLIESPRHCV